MELSANARQFILHWGEMASRWGVNRTVAQIHALLFVCTKPLNAEELTELLSVSRSNVSTSLRELQGLGVVRVVHVMGDRRDHFECLNDVWEMFQAILDERRRRVLEPAIDVVRQTIAMTSTANGEEAHVKARLQEMLEFLQMISGWYTEVRALSQHDIRELMSLAKTRGVVTASSHPHAAGKRK